MYEFHYLTGASNARLREAAQNEAYGRLGVLVTPDSRLHNQIPCYHAWAMDNACFAHAGEFDEAKFLGYLDRTINEVDGAQESCLFALAPDVFNPAEMKGDAVETIIRSLPVLRKIRSIGVPAALVAQDGMEEMDLEAIPWDCFDVLFLGGSDEFKLGYYAERPRGLCAYDRGHPETLAWARVIARAQAEGKEIHVGRVNSWARLCFSIAIGAASADGTIATRGPKRTEQVIHWMQRLSADLNDWDDDYQRQLTAEITGELAL